MAIRTAFPPDVHTRVRAYAGTPHSGSMRGRSEVAAPAHFHLRKIASMQIELHGMARFTQFYLHLAGARSLRPTVFVELIAYDVLSRLGSTPCSTANAACEIPSAVCSDSSVDSVGWFGMQGPWRQAQGLPIRARV